MIAVRNENLKNAVQVFGQRRAIEFNHGIECSEGLVGHIGLAVKFYEVGKQNGGDGVTLSFETNEKVVNEREVIGTAKFENESVIGRVRMAEIWLARGVVEDLLGEEGIRLGGNELLHPGRRPKWKSGRLLLFISVLLRWVLLLLAVIMVAMEM